MHSHYAAELSWTLILSAAEKLYPGFSALALKRRLRLIYSCLAIRKELEAFLRQPAHGSLLRELVTHPEMLGFVVWPYVNASWSVFQRFQALAQHHQAINTDMLTLAIPRSESLLIADMSDVSPGLRLVVDRAPWCLREGSLVFNQFVDEERTMSVAFSFGCENGERVAYVGSIQGSNQDSALEKYREIAKGLHGMRSRDFLIKAFQLLTWHIGVKRVLCVSEEERHHRHVYFGSAKAGHLHLNYNQVWEEHAGTRRSDGFYVLDSLPVVKPMESIAAKNRSLYRRRYALLDKLSADIACRFRGSDQSSPLK